MPRVTVLLPVYNAEKYIKEAIESMLNQTFRDFELLIINDGSTDKSLEIITSCKDGRIRLIVNEKNEGLIYSLNKGIEMAQGEYIARMDADDICMPERLEIQVEFMENNPNIGVVGSWTMTDSGEKKFIGKYYSDPAKIKSGFLFGTSLAHPTVMIKKGALGNFRYDENFKHAEDYDLWTRMADSVNFANLTEVLLMHRKHEESVSSTYTDIQTDNAFVIRKRQLEKIGIKATDEELILHSSLRSQSNIDPKIFIEKLEVWLNKIKKANYETGYLNDVALLKILKDRWYLACSANSELGLWILIKYLSSNLSSYNPITISKLFLKCLIK